jgi:hypothetical protein
VDGDPRSAAFASAVRCDACGVAVPLEVTRVRLFAGEPFISCTRCAARVRVPVFASGGWDGSPDGSPQRDGEPELRDDQADEYWGVVGPPSGYEQYEPSGYEPSGYEPVELPAPPVPELIERRAPGRPKLAYVPCRACGARVQVDPSQVHLTWTHASLPCPACTAEVRLRRSDAYRDFDAGFPWSFASYAGDEPEPRRGDRLKWLHRRR